MSISYIVIFRSPSSEGGEPIAAFDNDKDAINFVKALVANGGIDHSYELAQIYALPVNPTAKPAMYFPDSIYDSDDA